MKFVTISMTSWLEWWYWQSEDNRRMVGSVEWKSWYNNVGDWTYQSIAIPTLSFQMLPMT